MKIIMKRGLVLLIATVIIAPSYFLARPARALTRSSAAGRILLQTEGRGEAWYVPPSLTERIYLADGTAAYDTMRTYGLGVTNTDLAKIPVGLIAEQGEQDSDADGLPDKLEEALGTDSSKPDSDGDGFRDGPEVSGGFSPLGPGKPPINATFAKSVRGKILLQVQAKGQAWYVHPADGKRYYMTNGNAAYEIMKRLGLGAGSSLIQSFAISNRSINCGESKECFIRSVENAQPASVTWRFEFDLFGVHIDSVSSKQTTKNNTSYTYREHIIRGTYSMTEAQKAEALSSGLTEEQINDQLASAQAIFASLPVYVDTCAYQNHQTLASVLRKWETGDIHVGARVNLETGKTLLTEDYETIGQCERIQGDS